MITDKDFTLCCCWACKHCYLDLSAGYICTGKGEKPIAIGGNMEIHLSRDDCKNFKRNI